MDKPGSASWTGDLWGGLAAMLVSLPSAIAPTAASTGARSPTTTPTVKGISMSVRRSSVLIVIRRMFPA